MRTHHLWATHITALLLIPLMAVAQQRPTIPSTVQPGAIERQLNAPPEPQKAPPAAPIQAPETQAAPPNAASLTFVLKSIEIDGATAISATDLGQPYTGLIGKTISVADVYAMADAMTARYRNAGYILSSMIVPPQSITDGKVRLRAVEGYIANIRVEGYVARASLLDKMRAQVLADRPLRNATLERFLLLLNDLPRVTAQGVLEPASTPGAADLVVRLHIYHVGGSAGINNRGSRLEGPTQYKAGVDADSVLGLYESTAFQYLQADRYSELHLYALTHTERLTASGLDLTMSGSHSQADPALGAALAALNLNTDTTQARAQLSYPLIRSRASNLALRAEFTYNDSKSQSFGLTQTQDKISALRLGMSADISDSLAGLNSMDLEFGHGLSVLGASRFGDPLASRLGGHPDFWKATFYGARLQQIGYGFSALLAATGQYAFDHVLAPEEFAYGGEFFGRAYDASELVGDSGLAGKFELRFTFERFGRVGATLYAFGEDGKVWRREAQSDSTDSAVSAGGGLRLTIGTWLSGFVEAAKPTNHVVAAIGNKDVRVFGGIELSLP